MTFWCGFKFSKITLKKLVGESFSGFSCGKQSFFQIANRAYSCGQQGFTCEVGSVIMSVHCLGKFWIKFTKLKCQPVLQSWTINNWKFLPYCVNHACLNLDNRGVTYYDKYNFNLSHETWIKSRIIAFMHDRRCCGVDDFILVEN